MRRDRAPLPDEGIYRTILWVLVGTVVAGAVLSIAGETVLNNPGLSRLGAGIALVGGAIYAFFRWLGRREARRRAAGGAGADEPGEDDS